MKIERKKVNAKKFNTLCTGSVFEYEGVYFIKTYAVDTDFNDCYQVYDNTYNVVNLLTGQWDFFNPDCIVESIPNATLVV